MSALSNSIQVDTTTGKRSYQTTNTTGIGLVVSAATWGVGAYLTGAMQAVAQYSLTAASGGMKYDENGKITGGFDSLAAGISMAAKAAGQFGSDYFGGGQTGSFLASDITSTVLNVGIQYHNYSHGYQNSYAAVAGADLSRLGSLVGGLGGAMYGDSRTAEANALVKNGTSGGMTPEQIEAAMRRAGLYEEADGYKNQIEKLNLAREAQRNEQNELALQILQGLGYKREEIDQIMQENRNSIAIQDFLESIADGSSDASALRLRAAAYRNGSKGAVSTKTMAEGEALLTELNAKVNDITGGTRGLTNAELLLLATEYNIDSSYLFDSQTESTMQYFSTNNFSADYQAQLMIENALQQAMNNGPLPISMGNDDSWFSLFSPLYAESSKDPNVVRALNRLQRDEFNKREYFYMDGVKYKRDKISDVTFFEGISGEKTIRYVLTENGFQSYVRMGSGKWNADNNATFAPDGELWSGAQEWWNNSKQSIQQFILLYGESLAASSAFALFMHSKERENSGNTDLQPKLMTIDKNLDLSENIRGELIRNIQKDLIKLDDKNYIKTSIGGADVYVGTNYLKTRTLAETFNKMKLESLLVLKSMIVENNLTEIRLSSTWRPDKETWSPHLHGRGLDITHASMKNSDGKELSAWFYNTEVGTSEPILAKQLREWAFQQENISQVIGPWYHAGVRGWPKGWQINSLKEGVEWIHRHHLHLTIK